MVKVIRKLSLLLMVAGLSLIERGGPLRAAAAGERDDTRRIAFRIATIEQHGAAERLLSEAVIEGPPGTDFTVTLNSGRFRMKAKFLTDLTGANALSMRATLDTRRLYGYSERALPLYEEDEQQQSFTLGFDEQIVVLPFGRKGDDDQLRIAIIPAWSDQSNQSPSGKTRPLAISIMNESLAGAISVEASKIPHHYDVEAALLEDGREIARSSAVSMIEEPTELTLAPGTQAGDTHRADAAAVKLTVAGYNRGRPFDEAVISFDIDRVNDSTRESVATNWAGVCAVGRPLTYDLTNYYHGEAGRKYELQLTVKLASNESTP